MTKKSKGYANMPTYEPTEENSGSAHGILVQSVKEKGLSSDLSPSSGSGLQKLTIDEAIDGIPIGFFHFRLLALCGSSFLADAAEVNLLAFVSVCAGVEWDLTTAQIASITSSVFVGQFFGGLFWGPVADYIGRKRAFQLVVAIISVCGFCSAFSTSYYMLIILRMMAGFGIGGLTVPFDLLAEFVPANRRGEYLMKMEYFWTLGSLFVSAAAWLMLGKYGWRSLTMLNSTPTLIVSLIGAFLLPESPRWLMEAGRTEEAHQAILAAARINGDPDFDFELVEEVHGHGHGAAGHGHGHGGGGGAVSSVETGLVSKDATSFPPSEYTSSDGGRVGGGGMAGQEDGGQMQNDSSAANYQITGICDLCMMHFRLYANLLKKENRGFSFPLWTAWFSFGFGYYGIILFVARIYDNADTTHDNTGGHELTCNFDFMSIFVNASAELVGIFTTVNFIEVTGRTFICFCAFSLAAVTSMLMGATIGPTEMLVFSLIARAASVASNSTVWVMTPELYKTHVRATGHSSCNGFTRIGAFLSPFMVQSDLPNTAVASMIFCANMVGVMCTMCLPETLGRSIEDDIPLVDYPKVFLFGGVPRSILVKMFGWIICYEGDEVACRAY